MSSRFRDNEIRASNRVTSNGLYPALKDAYFYNGPLNVVDVIDNKPAYAGGKFIICEYNNDEVGFYINGVKKV
jgi:hypothetical protein